MSNRMWVQNGEVHYTDSEGIERVLRGDQIARAMKASPELVKGLEALRDALKNQTLTTNEALGAFNKMRDSDHSLYYKYKPVEPLNYLGGDNPLNYLGGDNPLNLDGTQKRPPEWWPKYIAEERLLDLEIPSALRRMNRPEYAARIDSGRYLEKPVSDPVWPKIKQALAPVFQTLKKTIALLMGVDYELEELPQVEREAQAEEQEECQDPSEGNGRIHDTGTDGEPPQGCAEEGCGGDGWVYDVDQEFNYEGVGEILPHAWVVDESSGSFSRRPCPQCGKEEE